MMVQILKTLKMIKWEKSNLSFNKDKNERALFIKNPHWKKKKLLSMIKIIA